MISAIRSRYHAVGGETKHFKFVLFKKDNTAYDLTNATIKAIVRNMFRDIVAELVVTTLNPTQGIVDVYIDSVKSLTAGNFFYDIRIQIGSAIDYLNVSTFDILETVSSDRTDDFILPELPIGYRYLTGVDGKVLTGSDNKVLYGVI